MGWDNQLCGCCGTYVEVGNSAVTFQVESSVECRDRESRTGVDVTRASHVDIGNSVKTKVGESFEVVTNLLSVHHTRYGAYLDDASW